MSAATLEFAEADLSDFYSPQRRDWESRDAAIARHRQVIWHTLQENGPAMMCSGDFSKTKTLAQDYVECSNFFLSLDDDMAARLIVNAANAQKNDELQAFYLQAIAMDVCSAVNAMVERAAVARELSA